MMKRISTILIASAALTAAASTAVTNSWNVDILRNTPAVWSIWRGDTLTLAANLNVFGITNAVFYWQAPEMGSLWWEKDAEFTSNGTVSVAWTPAMDSGAETYSFFFKAGDVYRPRGTLIMQASPGASVNSIPLPTPYIDFNLTSYTNAPWLLTELDPAAGAALEGHTSATNPHGITAEGIGALPLAGGVLDDGAKIEGSGSLGHFSLGDRLELSHRQESRLSTLSFDELLFYSPEGTLSYTGRGIMFDYSKWTGFRAPGEYEFASLADVDAAEAKISAHATSKSNPHGVTATQTGAPTIAAHDGAVSRIAAVEGAVASLPDAATVSNEAHNVATSLIGHPHVLQGSTVVPTTDYATALGGGARQGAGGTFDLVPYSATRPSENGSTGLLYIATAPESYIVDIDADMHVTQANQAGGVPRDHFPVEWRSRRIDETNWCIAAWCPGATSTYEPMPGEGYYAVISNLVVKTFSRPGYRPQTLTNDTAALPLLTDTYDIRRAARRLVASTEAVRNYVDDRKGEIAREAWRYTPSGKPAPSARTVTIDLPLVQQGSMVFLQSGDYFVMSNDGGEWRSVSEGSIWQIGAAGRADFALTSEGKIGHVREFILAGDVAHIYASTNWMSAGVEPYIETTADLTNPQWLAVQHSSIEYVVDAAHGDYWCCTVPAEEPRAFFRVMIPGGQRRIISAVTHRFDAGVELNGQVYDVITITNGTEVIEVIGRRLQ